MRFGSGTVITVALMMLVLTACGGGTAATNTPVPAPTAATSGGTSADASACPSPPASGQAAPPAGTRAMGVITAITDTTFTVTQPDKSTVPVMTTANTIYNIESASMVSAIGPGDLLMVAGDTTNGGIAATMIFDNGTQMMQRQRAALAAGCAYVPTGGNFTIGTVTKVNGTALTMAVAGGKSTNVTTDGTTKVTLRQLGKFADLKMNDQVTAMAGQASASPTPTSGFVAVVVNDAGPAQ
jgi:hypothetical protein